MEPGGLAFPTVLNRPAATAAEGRTQGHAIRNPVVGPRAQGKGAKEGICCKGEAGSEDQGERLRPGRGCQILLSLVPVLPFRLYV